MLWILEPKKAWNGSCWDKNYRVLVRARNEEEARAIAHEESGDENKSDADPWLDDKKTTCIILSESGNSEFIVAENSGW